MHPKGIYEAYLLSIYLHPKVKIAACRYRLENECHVSTNKDTPCRYRGVEPNVRQIRDLILESLPPVSDRATKFGGGGGSGSRRPTAAAQAIQHSRILRIL